MNFQVVTLFPEMVAEAAGHGVTGRGIERGLVRLGTVNPREFTRDRHRTVDDRPYGGGPGMVMKVEPLRDAIRAAKAAAPGARVVYLSPQGRRFDQSVAVGTVSAGSIVLVCGRYEGVDERLLEAEIDEEWSIGDYVLSGGEAAANVIVDAVSRLVPGVLGDEDSAEEDSFSGGLLDCPHYTRPEEVEGRRVPEVLLGGDHEAIRRWRLKQSLGRTWLRRPDLIEKAILDGERKRLLEEFKREHGGQPDQSQKAKGS